MQFYAYIACVNMKRLLYVHVSNNHVVHAILSEYTRKHLLYTPYDLTFYDDTYGMSTLNYLRAVIVINYHNIVPDIGQLFFNTYFCKVSFNQCHAYHYL